MSLAPGTRIGAYDVVALLGAGGMGEVYRARDTQLKRDVAIKVLPQGFAQDPDRLARFQREAELLATLNHHHIAAVYGLDKTADVTAIVLELVEGETLAERIAKDGPLPVVEALAMARQIAEALEAAHERGVIHRDLKPANIKITPDGRVKVLDFGLAKLAEGSTGGAAPTGLSMSPTLSLHGTFAGVILGTAAYMSPEQARGKPVDKRTDIWAFGCVLFEMLTGTRAFGGEDVTEIIAAVVRGEPDWTALPPEVPQQIRLLLTRCLEKDRHARVSDIGVAKFLLTEIIAPETVTSAKAAGTKPVRSGRRFAAGATAGLAAGVAVAAVAAWAAMNGRQAPAPRPMRFTIVPPSAQPLSLQGQNRHFALSPDGARIVYQNGPPGPQHKFVVRALDQLDASPLANVMGREPFLSPDGRWVGYFTTSELKKVSIDGGASITICRIPTGSPRGASWGANGTIVFAISTSRGGLMSVPASGGELRELTVAVPGREVGHLFPSFLPGDHAVVYTVSTAPIENSQIAVLDLTTGQRKTVLRGGSDAIYVQSGHLVYGADGGLRAVPFDVRRLEVTGDPVPVVEDVLTEQTGAANYAVSRTGTLMYVSGVSAVAAIQPRSLVWVNRQGREEPINAPPRPYAIPRLSPDGSRIALDVRDQSNDIWILDVARQTLAPLSIDPNLDMSPVWTPDGRRVIWTSTRGGGNPNLYWQAADGTGTAERLTSHTTAQFPTSVSADGSRVVFFGSASGVALDISTLALDRSVTPQPQSELLIESTFTKYDPEISPDGRWIAYASNESGRFEVFVRPYPNINEGRWQISPEGGTRPAWARSGKEIFYLDANDLLTSVPVQTTTGFSAGTATRILSTRYYAGSTSRGYDLRGYDVSLDGQRFLMVKETEAPQPSSTPPPSLTVVLNWLEELKARVPAK